MSTWNRLADELRTDVGFAQMNSMQLEAIIDILALTVCADGTVGVLEKMELERQLQKLPWFEYKEQTIRAHTEWALQQVQTIKDEVGFMALASQAAQKFGSPDTRARVFEMAATLACSDLHLHRKEKQALAWLAVALGVTESDAAAIIERVSREHL